MILSGGTTPASTVYGFDAAGEPISLTPEDEATHTMCLGATGSGKTMMACGAIAQNIRRPGSGSIVIIDPLGAMADYVLDFLGHINCLLRTQELSHPYRSFRLAAGRQRESLARRLLYLDFSKEGVGGHRLNLLNISRAFSPSESVGVTIQGFEQTVGDKMTLMRQLFTILRSGLTVASQSGRMLADLDDILLMKSSEAESLLSRLARRFPGVNGRPSFEHRFFEGFIMQSSGKERRELVKSTMNITQPLLSTPRLTEFFSGGPSTFDIQAAIESGNKIIIVKAAPGGELTTGRIASSMLLNAAVASVEKRPANARPKGYRPVRFYLDEYHTYADLEWLSVVLSTIRNRNAFFALFSQSLQQYPFSDPQLQRLAKGLRANTRTLISLAITAPDAAEVGQELFQLDGQMVARVRTRETLSEGETLALAFSRTVARSLGVIEGETTGETHGHSQGSTEGESEGVAKGVSTTIGTGITHTQGRSCSRTVGHGICVSTGSSQTVVETAGIAEGSSESESHGDFQGVSAGMPEGVLYSSLDGQKRRSDGQSDSVSSAVSRVESAARALGRATSTAQSKSRSTSTTEGVNSSEAHSETISRATSELSSAMKSLSRTLTQSFTKSRQHSSSTTETTSAARGQSQTHSRSRSRSTEQVTDYYSVAEERELRTQQLVALKNREFFMRKPDGSLVRGKTADLPAQPQYKLAGFDGKADLLGKAKPSLQPKTKPIKSAPTLSFLKPVPEELE